MSGTLENPIIVKSAGDEQYAGCTGYPADSHVTIWLTVRTIQLILMCSRDKFSRRFYRCPATALLKDAPNVVMCSRWTMLAQQKIPMLTIITTHTGTDTTTLKSQRPSLISFVPSTDRLGISKSRGMGVGWQKTQHVVE